MSEEYAKVGLVSDFPLGALKKLRVGNDDVVVANVDGRLYAITNSCTHRGGPLNEGELQGTLITCPWHGGQFNLTSGRAVSPPPSRDEITFDVRIEGSDVFLKKK
jgi:nitrite reductase/ring-hydroxylating ferredoxin subunit